MYPNIITNKQHDLLTFISQFKQNYYLVGGTAIALQLGHRHSIDFDLFTNKPINFNQIEQQINRTAFKWQLIFQDGDQITGILNHVKVTFYEYPYPIAAPIEFHNIILMPTILDLAAMKAYAMSRRNKWKDYVDLYVILNNQFSLSQISQKAQQIFKNNYSEKLFRQQLTYFEDIDYSEQIEWVGQKVDDQTIKQFLIDVATAEF